MMLPIRDTTGGSNQPASKSIVISIEPADTPAAEALEPMLESENNSFSLPS
jgi:hypothetical protein